MTKRILYIDNNAANVMLMERIAQAAGYAISVAHTAGAGWERVRQAQFDLILIDAQLLDSVTLIERIKQHTFLKKSVVAAFVASAERSRLVKEAGCDMLVYKPADIRQIQTLLHTAFVRKLAVSRPTSVAVAGVSL